MSTTNQPRNETGREPNNQWHGPLGVGHNSGAQRAAGPARPVTVFDQIEAIVDCPHYTAEQTCILIKIRCRAGGKTLTGALASNAGLMRAASITDWRTLRAELRELEGKSRKIPKDGGERH